VTTFCASVLFNLAKILHGSSGLTLLLRGNCSADKLPKLVLVGKCAWLYDETLRTLEKTGVKDTVVVTGYVPESDLPALYSGALCFVYPS
jgi:glycosyltransferase involved in cell wall biosynthesis